MEKKFHTNPDTAAKCLAFMGFSVPENDLLTSGIVCADEAIKLMPAAPYGYFVKGGIYSDRGDHEKALPFMEQINGAVRNNNEKIMFGHFYAKEPAFNKQHAKALMVINGLYVKFMNTLYVKNAEGSRQLWILNDANNPLIVKMDIGFIIILKVLSKGLKYINFTYIIRVGTFF